MSRTTRRALWAAVPLLAAAAVSLAFVLRPSAGPAAAVTAASQARITWAAGEQRAPELGLRHADGRPFSLASLRGRPVIVTFVDPHCTTFCPRESLVIDDALRALSATERPAVVAVSVDPKVTSSAALAREAKRFGWLPQWQWATGDAPQLRAAWRRYHITVIPTRGDITHTEAAYVVDANGWQRELLLWPFRKGRLLEALARSGA